MAVLEDSVSKMNPLHAQPRSSKFLQVSGLKITYNISNPIGSKVIDIKVRCRLCELPTYEDFDPAMDYSIVVMEYLADGKNGFHLISDNAKNKM